ncbi:MAG: ankyrin repeat domain-containing protein, partial [Treponema sp.]|nr:ankyrin repeat domain-containing protein [Treponema sp.]
RYHAETAEVLVRAGAHSTHSLHAYFAPGARIANYNFRLADGMAPIHYIARMGYNGYLDFILERGADVNIQNTSGATALHEAARSGNLYAMETLLRQRANVNVQDANGNSVMHVAVPPEKHFAAISLLIEWGANVNLRDDHGSSPLHVAVVLNRSNAIVSKILGAGADVSIRDAEGKTALYLAVENGRINLIPLLLSHGSDIFAGNNRGITPFQRALMQDVSLVNSMINRETILLKDSGGNNMLHVTMMTGGNPDVLTAILDVGDSLLNARNFAGDTALAIAVRLNNQEAGEVLLQRGADIFAVNSNGETPLSLTFPPAGRPATDLRRWMLSPQTLNARDGFGNTVLHYAAQWRLDHWIPSLVRVGANTEAANATGETPLFTAVRVDSPSTVRALAASGALLQARDTLGNSALHAAVRWQTLGSADTLIGLGLDVNNHALNGRTPLHDSVRLGMVEMQMLLLQRGANIEVRDSEGNTPLMETVVAGNIEAAQRLLSMNADPNTRNLSGDMPLHASVAIGRVDITNLLLSRGVSIHARNVQGRTPFNSALGAPPQMLRALLSGNRLHLVDDFGSSPLHIAVQERASPVTARTLIDLGARLSSVDSSGRTPVRLAVEMEQWDLARVLADSGADVFITAHDGKSAAEVGLTLGDPAIRALFSGRAIFLKDSSGNTILHYAARHGDAAIVSQLLLMGALKDAQNIAAERPVDIARRWNHHRAVSVLQ